MPLCAEAVRFISAKTFLSCFVAMVDGCPEYRAFLRVRHPRGFAVWFGPWSRFVQLRAQALTVDLPPNDERSFEPRVHVVSNDRQPFDATALRRFVYGGKALTVIWHQDIRHELNRSRQVAGFHTPAALAERLQRDFDGAVEHRRIVFLARRVRPDSPP